MKSLIIEALKWYKADERHTENNADQRQAHDNHNFCFI